MSGPLYLSANGQRVTSVSLLIPWYGAPVADFTLAGEGPLVAPVVLTVGNLSLTMAHARPPVAFAGSMTARLVGGFGGWGCAVSAASYANPKGVPLSMVLGDAARATWPAGALVGDSVRVATDRSVGLFYVREQGPASRVLRQLGGDEWWVDAAGVTRVGPRPASTIKGSTSVVDYRGGLGWLTVATEDPAAWMPGAVYSGNTVPAPITVSATRIRSGNDGVLRIEVLTI